jgi:flagellar export protein FliJ
MKKFRFRFEAVLHQREIVLDEKRGVLAEAQRKRSLAESLLEERRAALLSQLQAGPRVHTAFDASTELVRQRYILSLRQEIRRREQQLALIEQEVEKARVVVTEAHQAMRAIEVLREADEAEWRHAMKRDEERTTDEHNSSRHGRH